MSLRANSLWRFFSPMQYSMRLPVQLTKHIKEICLSKSMSIQRHTALIPVALSTISLVYYLTVFAKVPIHLTLTTSTFTVKMMVEIHPDKCIHKPEIYR